MATGAVKRTSSEGAQTASAKWGLYTGTDSTMPLKGPTNEPPVAQLTAAIKIKEPSSTHTSTSSLSIPASGSHTSCPDFGSLRQARYRVSSSGITISEARGEIWKECLKGSLLKRGFRYRRLWSARWVVLTGRMLSYYERPVDETADHAKTRGTLELTGETVVSFEESDVEGTFGFMIFPKGDKRRSSTSTSQSLSTASTELDMSSPSSVALMPIASQDDSRMSTGNNHESDNVSQGSSSLSCSLGPQLNRRKPSKENVGWFSSWFRSGDDVAEDIWYFRARTARERETWVRSIQRVVALIKRVEMAPTLVGVGKFENHYEIKREIGTGRFGTVMLAVARATGEFFAVKVLNKALVVSSPDASMTLSMEIRVLRKVTKGRDHPNICKMYHSFSDPPIAYLVIEYLGGGSLLDRIHRKGNFAEPEAMGVVAQVASALKELHSNLIVLCDLNPANLLYETPDSDVIKVCEFGRALIMPPGLVAAQARNNQEPTIVSSSTGESQPIKRTKNPSHNALSSFVTNQQVVGTPGYIAPEILSHKQYSASCDIYSLGGITFAMLTGASPLLGAEASKPPPRAALDQVLADASISLDARDLISKMMHPDRSERLKTHQVLDHPSVVSRPINSTAFPRTPSPSSINQYGARSNLRSRLRGTIHYVLFIVRTLRIVRKLVIPVGPDSFVRAQPPPPLRLRKVESRRSTDTSSGVSQIELRNQWLTLDGYAQRVRSENRLDELSPIFKSHTGTANRVNSSASGFTGVGISASVAGQLSELAGEAAEAREPVRPPGPFLAALEAHLRAEACSTSLSSDEDEEEPSEDDEENLARTSVSTNPQVPSKFEKIDEEPNGISEQSKAAESILVSGEATMDEEYLAKASPTTRRIQALKAWKDMIEDSLSE